MLVSSEGGGGRRTVTNSGLWTICVFRVVTFKRPEMTFKSSEYLLIMNFDYFVPISFTMLVYCWVKFVDNMRRWPNVDLLLG